MKRLLIVLATLVAAAGLAAVRPDAAAANDTAAVAVNTKDGSSIFRLAFAIRRVGGELVDNANAAVAFASCVDCRTVAISIQVVLVTGNPDVVTPQNIAIAMNELCTACVTIALAFQWVLSVDGPVHFTAEGNQTLAEIRRELQDLRDSDLPPDQFSARVRTLMQRLAQVLENELVAAGRSGPSSGPGEGTTTTTEPTQTTTETTPTEPGATTVTP